MLARREHSETELTRKLRTKGHPDSNIQSVLNSLTQEGLLSNARFVESYIRARQTKGYGPMRIRLELQARGLAQEFIEDHLNITDNAWFASAVRVWQKRFKGLKPRDFKARAQQMRFLQYRGFTEEQIESIFDSDR